MCDSAVLGDTLLSSFLYMFTSPGDQMTAPQRRSVTPAPLPMKGNLEGRGLGGGGGDKHIFVLGVGGGGVSWLPP